LVVSRLFLVRHAEAAGADGDPGLSPTGVTQARLLGERLRDQGVVGVRHGPRRRAAETAAVLGEVCGVPVMADGALEDRTPVPGPGQEALYPDRMRPWFAAVPPAERDEGGDRISAAVRTYLADDQPLVLVTHAFVVAWFVQQMLGAPANAWPWISAANAGLTTIDRRPGRPPQLIGANDVGHLLRDGT
jgi:serine/threonine-protein phosphatase PGAM5